MDWGWNEPANRAANVRPDSVDIRAEELPEVVSLREEGWHSDLGGGWEFLPCVWPPQHRTWVPNRSTHYAWERCVDYSQDPQGIESPRRRVRWTPALLAEWEAGANAELEGLGLPTPRPIGRIWLLRPFGGFGSVEEMLRHLNRAAEAQGIEHKICPEFVAVVVAELRRFLGG